MVKLENMKAGIITRNSGMAFLIILVLSIYWKSIYGDFVIDDRTFFIDNDILPNLKWWAPGDVLFRPSNYWGGELLPARELLFAIEYGLFGLNPMGYHFVSIGLYAAVCCIVYALLRSLYRQHSGDEYCLPGVKSGESSPLLVAALFASHPVHVEAVAYISSQKDLLSSMFSLICICAFHAFSNSEKNRKNLFILGILSYYLALLSKLTAIALSVFVPVVLLTGLFERNRSWKVVGAWVAANIPAALWLLWCTNAQEPYWKFNAAASALPFAERLVAAVKIMGAHLLLALKPFPLSNGYPFDASAAFDAALLAGVSAASLMCILVYLCKRDRIVVLACSLIVLFLAPVLQMHGSLNNASIYDRYLFIPVLGAAMIADKMIRGLNSILKKSSKWAPSAVLAVLIAAYSILTVSYVPAFRDDVAVGKNSYENFPQWPGSAFSYVYALIEKGRLDEAYAITLKEKTFDTPPWVRYYFLGWISLERNNLNEAISNLRISSYLESAGGYFPFADIPLARALLLRGQRTDAVSLLEGVVRSPIYQPLEFYHAKKLLEGLGITAHR